MNGGQVGVVGLDKRIAALAEVLARERMHEANVVADTTERVAGEVVIPTGAFDRDDQVADVVVRTGLLQLSEGRLQLDAVVGNLGRRDKDVAVEIGEHPFEPRLGTIDADDAKVLRTDSLDAGVNDPPGLVNERGKPSAGAFAESSGSHGSYLQGKGKEHLFHYP